jgi:Flp pilus assembly protein TadG
MRSLLHDKAANTIVISAAALLPLTAMVGGGVDASRYYMAAARMQAACDAGALAARRAMVTDTFTTEHSTIGYNFFDQNFETAMFGIQERERLYTSDGDGTVTGTASGTLPTSIMGIFGYEGFDIDVTCSAEINISNSDIMFVLDTTGSMADCPDGSDCMSGTGSKIVGLRAAVLNFYDTVEAATSDSAQVRYGFVPYSQQANVGFLIPSQFRATSHTYQSREANFTTTPGTYAEVSRTINSLTVKSKGTSATVVRTTVFGTTAAACTALKPANKVEFNDDLGLFNQQSQTVVGNIRTTVYNDTDEDIYVFEAFDSQHRTSDGRCRYGWNRFDGKGDALWTLVEQRGPDVQTFSNWTYKPVTFNLTSLYDDNQISLPIGTNGAGATQTWGGCMEEAATVDTATYDPLPAGAHARPFGRRDGGIRLHRADRAQPRDAGDRNRIFRHHPHAGQPDRDAGGRQHLAHRRTGRPDRAQGL